MRKKLSMLVVMLALVITLVPALPAVAAHAAAVTTTVKKSGSKYYLYDKNGKRVTGLKKVAEYPAGSKNYYYFVNTKGRIRVGLFQKNKLTYFGKENGVLATKWVITGGKKYYFSTKTHAAVTGKKKISKKYYYFSATGAQVAGFVKITSKKGNTFTLYFDPQNGGVRTTGLKEIDGKTYYFNNNGHMRTGRIKVDDKYYFFGSAGYRVSGLQTYYGKKYYFHKKTFAGMTGWKAITTNNVKKYYYFSTDTSKLGQAVTGFNEIGGKKYYFNDEGELQTGWQTINGKKYYFNPNKDATSKKPGVMFTGKQTIDGKEYNFGTDGALTEPTGVFSLRVNLSTNVTTAYKGGTPVRGMYCSPGAATAKIVGTHTLQDKLRWHELMGPSWGQYCEHITSNMLFHSIPYSRNGDRSSMPYSAFNQLGQAVSHGCIRLACGDAYYIYTNCIPGVTKVTIGYFGNTDPITPTRVWAPANSGYGYDPTDPLGSG